MSFRFPQQGAAVLENRFEISESEVRSQSDRAQGRHATGASRYLLEQPNASEVKRTVSAMESTGDTVDSLRHCALYKPKSLWIALKPNSGEQF